MASSPGPKAPPADPPKSTSRKRGVWVARYADGKAVFVFASELAALRHAVTQTMEVAFIPYGENANGTGPKA